MNPKRTATVTAFGKWNRLALVMAGILLVSWGGPAASAFWGSVGTGSGASVADAVAQGAKPTTAVSGANVTVSWAASTTAAGRPVGGYSIARYGTATGGTKVPATGGCGSSVAGLSCIESNVPAGTWYYSVTPMLSLWQGTESTRSVGTTPVTDTTPPLAPVVTAPTYVHQGNVTNVPVGGTAEANSTVVLTVTGSGAAAITQNLTTSGAGNWNAAPLNLSAYNPGTITFSAKATDAAGNTGPAGTATSTKDVSSPTVTGVLLTNGGTAGTVDKGDKVTLTFSERLSGSSMCNTWANAPATLTGNGVVTVKVDADSNLTVTSTACTVNLGSVYLGASYTTKDLTFSGNGQGGNMSTVAWDGNGTIVITLGTASGSGTTGLANAVPVYTPATNITDIATNPVVPGGVSGTPSRF
ncbi:hypothetical protein [Arthrobacter sp. fls2-241-R2A-172]|uniref:hypothetical protein n=1 Tax=Arthrobacter sp. fls2-241-R2A-172 TaxID=3040325 RepID=UPI00254DC5EC|nr:hypothetical protein [Arthrobacter sp. fls2-241-R2A-172]